MNFRILELCKERGITQKALSEMIGLSAVGLSKAINGNPTVGTLEKIAKALDVEVTELFEISDGELTALVDYKGELHRFDSIEALERFVFGVKSSKG